MRLVQDRRLWHKAEKASSGSIKINENDDDYQIHKKKHNSIGDYEDKSLNNNTNFVVTINWLDESEFT